MEKRNSHELNSILKLKKSITTIALKNGEIVLVDTECGKWAKTSVSFIPLLKDLKKGLPKGIVKEKIKARFKDKSQEIFNVLDVITKNDLLELLGQEDQVKVVDIYKLKTVRVLANPTIKKDTLVPLIDQLQATRANDRIEIIFDIEKEKINFSQIKCIINQLNTNPPSLRFIIRMDFNELLNKEIDLLTKVETIKFQINYNLDKDTFERYEKKVLRMQQLNKRGNIIELRYPIVDFFNSNKKKQLIINFLNLPFNSYYFTWDEIAKNEYIRDKKQYFKNLVPALNYFIEETSTIVQDGYLKNIYMENSIISSILFPIKRNSCSAGINNFYINQHGEILPCKHSQQIKLADFSRSDYPPIRLECDSCIYKCFCGGICKCIQQDPIFNKLCKIQKKTLKQCFSMLRIDLLKKVEEAARDYTSVNKDPEVITHDIELLQEQLIRRQTCSIGLY